MKLLTEIDRAIIIAQISNCCISDKHLNKSIAALNLMSDEQLLKGANLLGIHIPNPKITKAIGEGKQ
jgi:hypothetical protein